jgi:hypothetical protein
LPAPGGLAERVSQISLSSQLAASTAATSDASADAYCIADGVAGHLAIIKLRSIITYAALLVIICGVCGLVVHRLLNPSPTLENAIHSVSEHR